MENVKLSSVEMNVNKKLSKKLSLNYFPNDQTKHIDYVIFYKDIPNIKNKEKTKQMRNKFIKQLKKNEGFEIHKIERKRDKKDNSKSIYLLLNCSLERLMQEAERMHLEIPLKDFELIEENKSLISMECFDYIKKCFKKPLNNEDNIDYVSAPFQNDIRFIFEGFEVEIKDCKGFTNTIRSLLVDNILKNMNFNVSNEDEEESLKDTLRTVIDAVTTEQINEDNDRILTTVSKKLHKRRSTIILDNTLVSQKLTTFSGLPYMLKKKYFDDAFILHDEHYGPKQINEIMIHMMNDDSYEDFEDATIYDDLNTNSNNNNQYINKDTRSKLNENWAKLKNLFKFQPLWLIRDYFGEMVTLYFAFSGTLLASLWFPVIIGIIFFIIGVINSVSTNDKIANITSIPDYGNYYINIFADSFDGYLTLPYAIIICLWGSILTEYWKRESARLAYEWDTDNFEKQELDRVEYVQTLEKYREKIGNKRAEFSEYIKYMKYITSFCILILMVCVVAINIALIVVFRIYIKTKVFSNDYTLQVIIGDVGSTILNTILIMIMNKLYGFVAVRLTNWENPRTQTEYEDSLVLKLFAFEFVNSYGSLFYIAFFRTLKYENGYFNLGPEYQDSCDRDNCMALLSIQVLVVLLIKPFPRFFLTVILPYFKNWYKYISLKRYIKTVPEIKKNAAETGVEINKTSNPNKFNDFRQFVFVSSERKKNNFDSNIRDEYMEKVILYGYIMLFACSFTLGPLLFLLIIIIDIRIDAKRMLWIYKRPIPLIAQDIGMFHYLIQFINVCGIVSNGFIIAFTSNWSKQNLSTLQNRLTYVAIFEHSIFFVWILISLFPDTSNRVLLKMRQEVKYANEMVIAAKESVIKKQNIIATKALDKTASILKAKKNFDESAKEADNEEFDYRRLDEYSFKNRRHSSIPPIMSSNENHSGIEAYNFNQNETYDDYYRDDNNDDEFNRNFRKKNKFNKRTSKIYPDVEQ